MRPLAMYLGLAVAQVHRISAPVPLQSVEPRPKVLTLVDHVGSAENLLDAGVGLRLAYTGKRTARREDRTRDRSIDRVPQLRN